MATYIQGLLVLFEIKVISVRKKTKEISAIIYIDAQLLRPTRRWLKNKETRSKYAVSRAINVKN